MWFLALLSAFSKMGVMVEAWYPQIRIASKNELSSLMMSWSFEQRRKIQRTLPIISPVRTPGGWQDLGGMKSWRVSGFLNNCVASLPFSIEIVMSKNVACNERVENVQVKPLWLTLFLKSCQLFLWTSGLVSCSQIPNPSSINLLRKRIGFGR